MDTWSGLYLQDQLGATASKAALAFAAFSAALCVGRLFAGEADALSDRKSEVVLTPHLGEFSRLMDARDDDRLAAARRLAERADAVALLKGSRTVVVARDGAARINPTGSPVLATAGTGDVLTGAIGGLLARGVDPFAAAWSGAYLHGLAGIAAGRALAEGTVAGDVAERLPEAIETVRAQAR